MLSLIIKGDRFQAARAAADRGIPFAFRNETAHNETVGLTATAQIERVVAWLRESDQINRASPLPAGTLLCCSQHEASAFFARTSTKNGRKRVVVGPYPTRAAAVEAVFAADPKARRCSTSLSWRDQESHCDIRWHNRGE